MSSYKWIVTMRQLRLRLRPSRRRRSPPGSPSSPPHCSTRAGPSPTSIQINQSINQSTMSTNHSIAYKRSICTIVRRQTKSVICLGFFSSSCVHFVYPSVSVFASLFKYFCVLTEIHPTNKYQIL